MRRDPLPLACVGAALLAACAVGPDFQRPAAPAVSGYTRQALPAGTAGAGTLAQAFRQGQQVPQRWWAQFGSPELDAMVERALQANPDLESARAALRVAQELARAQAGALWPSASAGFTPSRQRISAQTTSPLSSGESVFNLHTAQVSVSYAPDVFGGTRRALEASQAQAEAQRFQMQAAYVTLTTNVVVGAVQAASLRAQIDATDGSIRSAAGQLRVLKRQLELGEVAESAVLAQQAALAQARAARPALDKQLQWQLDQLATLTGQLAADVPRPAAIDLASLRLPADLPVSLPAQLVRQRPDIQAAEAQLHAASAQIGVAVANMLPQLTLTASGGAMATQIASLTSSGNVFWSIAANATQPLFEGGALLHRRRAAQAAYDQAAAQYRSAVLSAFQNVADVLQAIQSDAEALADATLAEQSAAASLQVAGRQLELGDISPLAVLQAEQAHQQARLALIQAQASRLTDTAALFQALGGGWSDR